MKSICKHPRQEFLGIQDFGPGGPPPLALYNCLDCRSTVSRPHKENDMSEASEEITDKDNPINNAGVGL